MAELRFYFGTMGSGKSTQALQINHNLRSRGLKTMLCSQLDREDGKVSSRLGVSAVAEQVTDSVNVYTLAQRTAEVHGGLDAVVADEAQFYSTTQIEQLARIVDEMGVEVYAFGLLTSFQGELFEGTKRLLELADIRSEVQVEARCWCGRRATHNARLVDGSQVYDGQLKVVGDTNVNDDAVVSYELRCRDHWHTALRELQGQQRELFEDE
jgi:thymidine kinase